MAVVTKINPNFAAHVTSTAFHLSLSRSMILCLTDVANRREPGPPTSLRIAGIHDTYVPTCWRLRERGLIYSPDPEWPGRYEMTDAGLLVVELLKMAGLIEYPVELQVAS